jgi:hypothetical protein
MTGVVVTAALALAGAVALSVAGWLDAAHAFLLAAALVTVVIVWRGLDAGAEAPLPHLPQERRAGGRHDVSELAWATLTRDRTVSRRVLRRVRAVAVTRLRRLGVDLDDPAQRAAAERLLGADVVDGLVYLRPPAPHTLHAWLDAIERVGSEPVPRTGRHPG